MPGFLDPHAASVEAEYTRYLDPDILGKIVLKNFALNVLNIADRHIRIPVGRHGDVGNFQDLCDAGIRIGSRWFSVETKCSRQVVAKNSRCAADPAPRWNFSGCLHSARGRERCEYELLFAVGVNLPGLEDSMGYWKQLNSLRKKHLAEGRPFDFSVWPHDAAFLPRCGIFIIPRQFLKVNQLDVTIRNIPQRKEFEFFSWGDDFTRLREIWKRATNIVGAPSSS